MMNSIFKNLLYVLKRFKVSSILNIIGLSVAFAAFLIVIMQVNFELSFDKCHPNAGRIYRVDNANLTTGDMFAIIQPRPLLESFFRSSSQIEQGIVLMPYIGEQYFTITSGNTKNGYKESFSLTSPDITKIFGFNLLQGNTDCLNDPQNILIPESMAEQIFGNEGALGKQIELEKPIWMKRGQTVLTIGGVYKDFPANTQLNNYIYTSLDKDAQANNWDSSNFFGYILLGEGSDPQAITDNFNRNFDYNSVGLEDVQISLTPLTSIYFKNESQDGLIAKSGNPNTPIILISIAILIIVLAVINYTNFNMALAPQRIKSINTRKVLGSTNISLRLSITAEGVFISILSFILTILIVYILYINKILTFINADLNLVNNIPLIIMGLLIAVIVGIVASLRPAFYLTSYSPALVLKGNFGLSASGQKLRTLLVGFQFFTSIVLIIASAFIYKQNHYMQNFTLGFDTDNIVLTELSAGLWENDKNTLVNKLKENSDIVDVAFTQQKFGASDQYRQESFKVNDEYQPFYYIPVSWNFTQLMDIKAIDGKLPDATYEENWSPYYKNEPELWDKYAKSKRYLIINKKMSDTYGIKAGDFVDHFGTGEQVLAVIDNIKFTSLRKESSNLALVINDPYALPAAFIYIRIKAGADIRHAMSYIEKTFSEIDPAFPVKLEFYNQVYDTLYKHEKDMEKIISLFSFLAIIISIVGVFGLVMFECEYKQKEISVRKVLGSSITEILQLFNKTYIRIFLICFILSVPVTYYIVANWLNNFVYKTTISWWVFILSGLGVSIIIILTVSWQSWRAATANPVDALKNE